MSSSGYPTYREYTIISTRPHLVIQMRAWGKNDKLLIRGEDNGKLPVSGSLSGGTGDFQIYSLDVSERAEWIELEVVPQKPLKAEFFVPQPKN